MEEYNKILLTVEYDGAGFAGWQRQANFRTVQGEIEQAVSRAVGRPTTIWGASRTDAGVNALGQRAHFYNYSTIPAEKFPFVLNTMLPPDVRARAAREIPEGIHARFSCRGKIYTYRIYNNRHASAMRRNFTTHVPVPVDESGHARFRGLPGVGRHGQDHRAHPVRHRYRPAGRRHHPGRAR